jgi:hypothetical protein
VCVAWEKDEHDGQYGTPFTAILGAEAVPEREAEASLNSDITRILVRGHTVGLADLMAPGEKVLPAAQLLVALRSKYGAAPVRDFKSGGEYLATLYAYLKGDTNPVSREEAESAMKAFISAIAYRQPDDIDGLIREEILDEIDNEALIQRLMETIREVNRLKNEAARMEQNIAQLEAAEQDLRASFDAFMDERMFHALIDIRGADDVREKRGDKTAARGQNQNELDAIGVTIDARKVQQETLQKQHAELQARISQNDVYSTKKKLEALIDEQDRVMDAVLSRIQHAVTGFAKAAQDVAYMQSVVTAFPDLSDQRTTVEELTRQFELVSLPALEAAVQAVRNRLGDEPVVVMQSNCAALLSCIGNGWDTAVNAEHGLRAAFIAASRNVENAFEQAS